MEEEWRWVPGYEGAYEVSDQGRVRSYKRVGPPYGVADEPQRVLETSPRRGYPSVQLARNGDSRSVTVHKLVLLAFVGEPPEGYEGSHINGDQTDNRLSNLAWETRSENHRRKADHGTTGPVEKGTDRRPSTPRKSSK